MRLFVCAKYLDKYLIASRYSRSGLIINEKAYYRIVELSKSNSNITSWIAELLSQLGVIVKTDQKINDVILVRKPTNLNYGRASYEITESCNYLCKHCFLGEKKKDKLSITDKKNILKKIQNSGCVWLQITGGEPLFDPHFIELYSFAYSLGFLITISTNGYMLSESKIISILDTYPPYRLTISAYGATAYSYESLTGIPGSFNRFMLNLTLLSKKAIRVRLNIIVTKYNQDEIAEMVRISKSLGFEYQIFRTISPTIDGNVNTTEIMSQKCEIIERCNELKSESLFYVECDAGETSFNVNSHGMMSICKIVRNPSINLLNDDIIGFDKLRHAKDELNKEYSLCTSCEYRMECPTCPHILKLYNMASNIPLDVCKKAKNGKIL